MYKNSFYERSGPAIEVDYKAIGKRINIAHIKKNPTQEAIADKIDITRNMSSILKREMLRSV